MEAFGGGQLYTSLLPPGADHVRQHQTACALLEQALGVRDPVYGKASKGKPYLIDFPERQFSMTHCEGLAACLVASSPCGLDAEAIRPFRTRVLCRAFTEREQRQILQSQNPEELFFRLWTLKESFVKATGDGLSYRLDRVPVLLAPDGSVKSLAPEWRFSQTILYGRFVLSACLRQSVEAAAQRLTDPSCSGSAENLCSP